jgi:hypothetical protein
MTGWKQQMIQAERIPTFEDAETVWRVLNMAAFIAAFFGPWGTIFGDVMYGADMVVMSFRFVVLWILGFGVSGYWAGFGLYYCLGWTCLGLYWLVNGIRAFGKSRAWRIHWLTIPLAISTVFLLFDTFPRVFRDNYNRFWWPSLYWGYWLLLFSVGSSVVIEIIGYLADRAERQKGTA